MRSSPATRPSNRKQPEPRRRKNCTRFTGNCISHSAKAVNCRNCGKSPRAREEARAVEALRAEVYEANLELVRRALGLYTFGNTSGISRAQKLVQTKPSGVPSDKIAPADTIITHL